MKFSDPISAIRHAAYRATASGKAWGVYLLRGEFIAAPRGSRASVGLIEVCKP